MIPGPITSWSKSLLRYKTKPMVMDAAATDKTNLMKEEKDGPSRAMLRSILVNAYAIIIVLCISIDKSIIRTRSLRNTHSQETQHLSWETL
jgi:hypothetical protein